MENKAGGDAKIVLRFAVAGGFGEARKQVFNLRGPERKTVEELNVNAAAERRGERVVRGGCTETAAAGVCDAEESLREGSDAFEFAVGNARAEEISGDSAVDSCAENVVCVIAAEIGDGAKPM